MSVTINHLRTLQATECGHAVTITRGAQSCALTAVAAAVRTWVTGPDGARTEMMLNDWLIEREDFTLINPDYPVKGDLITLVADVTERYLVNHPDPSQPVYHRFGPDEPTVAWRIHSASR